MKKLIGLVLGATLAFSAVGCDKPEPQLDTLAMNPDLTSSKGIQMKNRHTFAAGDSATSEALRAVFYDGKAGMSVTEGAAGIIIVVPLFEDSSQVKVLGGGLKYKSSAPDVFELQLLPKEDRKLVVLGKKVGHADITIELDGIAGSVTVPVDVTAQEAP